CMNLTKKSNDGPLSDGRRSDNDRQSGIDIRSKKENRWLGDRRSSTSDRVWAGTGDRNFVTNLKSTSSDFSFCAQNQAIKHRLKSASAVVSPEPKKTIFARCCPVALASTSAALLKNFDTRGDFDCGSRDLRGTAQNGSPKNTTRLRSFPVTCRQGCGRHSRFHE
ncbi:MAG: hypothetical protein WBV51_02480, partial [Pseudolabrys sp.]